MSSRMTDEDEKREQWARKIREMKRKKRKQQQRLILMKYAAMCLGGICLIAVLVLAGKKIFSKGSDEVVKAAGATNAEAGIRDIDVTAEQDELAVNSDASIDQPEQNSDTAEATDHQSIEYNAPNDTEASSLNGDVISNYGILLDVSQNKIIAKRNATTRINPASMTKVLTVLVAAEHMKSLDDTFTITTEITDYSYVNDCSNAGFEDGETVTVKDLFYGTILPSGGEAALALATYIAGSQENFVKLMNEKAAELGLSDTAHFTNCIGIYDENHYCTVYDMAMIMRAAVDNALCKEVLSAHTYTTSATAQHPDGITISNWFLRRIEDKDSGGTVLCGKTGYVVQSGNCAVSYAQSSDGTGFICVTADATSGWRCIYDHVAIYKKYIS